MGSLKSWKAEELRQMARRFRRQAGATQLPKYVELLCHTADDLEIEAEALEHVPAANAGVHVDIRV